MFMSFFFFFGWKEIVEDDVLHKAQRGLFFGKPKFGIFVTAWYKKDLTPDSPDVHKGIVEAVCDVIKYALDLEKADESGKNLLTFCQYFC